MFQRLWLLCSTGELFPTEKLSILSYLYLEKIMANGKTPLNLTYKQGRSQGVRPSPQSKYCFRFLG